ncbi:unnamed protein product [Hymenolepis diminuta]|uniref:Uncharacterized protein n=1 Tax=Hymenolepis diminuta TaxID=6216 RepID=A0A564YMT9_HYMDI|nr:unnamed protein product [Hymenolepis diminuta]
MRTHIWITYGYCYRDIITGADQNQKQIRLLGGAFGYMKSRAQICGHLGMVMIWALEHDVDPTHIAALKYFEAPGIF